MSQIKIFDTTLRDGEQSPGVNLNQLEKLEIAKQLERFGVDRMEAGFPASSKGDFQAVKAIADTIKHTSVTGLARTVQSDIDIAWEALKGADEPCLHIFLATSPIHMTYKLKKTPDDVIETAVNMVSYARKKFPQVEWSAEDASRSDWSFLAQIIERVIDAGATVINLPDTVGYTTPKEYGSMFQFIRSSVPNIDRVTLSCHCHNDLGMAVANSIAAVENGATQVEGTINGIGERAGNASLEEIAVALKIRSDYYPYATNLNLQEIKRTSDMVAKLTGMYIQANKAVVGRNAFAHESGIHQDGVLKHASTYEIITPELVGVNANTLFLGKHSGRHAFKDKIKELGINVSEENIKKAFDLFKQLTDHKKEVTDDDIFTIVTEVQTDTASVDKYQLKLFQLQYGSNNIPTAAVELITPTGKTVKTACTGQGSVEALYKTLDTLTEENTRLIDYQLNSVGGGKDALAESRVQLLVNGETVNGRGSAQDVMEASVQAYLNAVNRFIIQHQNSNKAEVVK
ncbi:MAG: 2-isopropylmalate synthase [Bacillota bacterium]|uniref:2-isopropylmalate synthase n=1 Tax=Virgibacillus TaxID=84406 RepID=UPI0004271810|nr:MULTISPECIES: 2-isopropylmalate synthase [Bacillaceae]MCC2249932.1 2-isopropylmalate synthase [Virgibacillus sp. AGTR]MDY7044156.1 2-isopropylmalate synthase [Virgibacillus sp. M23]QRZ18190.1 2-isopropylmalate synthase [Virgibacillus sp. AGTR]WBX82133.1 2-isopropylmalate synthase [Virgibacillus salarius]